MTAASKDNELQHHGIVHKRIAVVLHAADHGGAEGIAVRLAGHWLSLGHKVQLVTIARATNPMPLPQGLAETCLGHPAHSGNAFIRLIRLARTRGALSRALKDFAPDIIVSHGDRTNVLALLAAWGLPTKTIVVEHNHPDLHAIGGFWNRLRTLTYQHASRIIGVSAGVVAAMPPDWQAKAHAIHNPILPLIPPDDVAPIPQHIVGMGRLAHQKGFDLLIDAFARVHAKHPAARLTIYGDGPERFALMTQIARLQLEDAVKLPGRAPDPAHALSAAAIFAFPSRYEGFGLALGEAMSLGLPVIAADCPSGPGEMIRNGENGLLVPPENAEALADALLSLLDDPAYAARLGEAARAIAEEFSLARHLAAWDAALMFDAPKPA